MLGTGLIGDFYTAALNRSRNQDRVDLVYSRTDERAEAFKQRWDVPRSTTSLAEACSDPGIDTVVVGLPNDMHEDAIRLAAENGKSVLCTKPLGRTTAEAKRILDIVEQHGVFAGYLEDLAYTPKTLDAVQSVQDGALGDVLWVRSRECHPGPHSAWFWDEQRAGGGAIVDLGCHCIEVTRLYVGKGNRPVEVFCWKDTLVHPVSAEDHAVAMIRYESGAVGQFEVSWSFRGGMDLRDEVEGTEGTIWMNHFLRTGYEMFTTGAGRGYVAEKAESTSGWLFPVADEIHTLGYIDMFNDMFEAMDNDRQPQETFYDGYVVNAIMDACYASADSGKWEPVDLEWRGKTTPRISRRVETHGGHPVIKRETLPDGRTKVLFEDRETGEVREEVLGQ